MAEGINDARKMLAQRQELMQERNIKLLADVRRLVSSSRSLLLTTARSCVLGVTDSESHSGKGQLAPPPMLRLRHLDPGTQVQQRALSLQESLRGTPSPPPPQRSPAQPNESSQTEQQLQQQQPLRPSSGSAQSLRNFLSEALSRWEEEDQEWPAEGASEPSSPARTGSMHAAASMPSLALSPGRPGWLAEYYGEPEPSAEAAAAIEEAERVLSKASRRSVAPASPSSSPPASPPSPRPFGSPERLTQSTAPEPASPLQPRSPPDQPQPMKYPPQSPLQAPPQLSPPPASPEPPRSPPETVNDVPPEAIQELLRRLPGVRSPPESGSGSSSGSGKPSPAQPSLARTGGLDPAPLRKMGIRFIHPDDDPPWEPLPVVPRSSSRGHSRERSPAAGWLAKPVVADDGASGPLAAAPGGSSGDGGAAGRSRYRERSSGRTPSPPLRQLQLQPQTPPPAQPQPYAAQRQPQQPHVSSQHQRPAPAVQSPAVALEAGLIAERYELLLQKERQDADDALAASTSLLQEAQVSGPARGRSASTLSAVAQCRPVNLLGCEMCASSSSPLEQSCLSLGLLRRRSCCRRGLYERGQRCLQGRRPPPPRRLPLSPPNRLRISSARSRRDCPLVFAHCA